MPKLKELFEAVNAQINNRSDDEARADLTVCYLMMTSFTACSLKSSLMRLRIFSR